VTQNQKVVEFASLLRRLLLLGLLLLAAHKDASVGGLGEVCVRVLARLNHLLLKEGPLHAGRQLLLKKCGLLLRLHDVSHLAHRLFQLFQLGLDLLAGFALLRCFVHFVAEAQALVHPPAWLRFVFETVGHGVVVVRVFAAPVSRLQHRLKVFQDLLLFGEVTLAVEKFVYFAELVDHFLRLVLDFEAFYLHVDALLGHRRRPQILIVPVYWLVAIAVALPL